MRATEQLHLAAALIKSAARGEQALKLLQSVTQPTLERAMSRPTAQALSHFAQLPNPLAKPPLLPVRGGAQLRMDWQPALTKDVTGTKWNTFINTGRPDAAGAEWLNNMQRSSLAKGLVKLRQVVRNPNYFRV